MGKEGDACNALYLTNAVDVGVSLAPSVGVTTDKANAFGRSIQTKYNLEEGFWHDNLVGTYGFMLLSKEYRTAYNIDIAISLSPAATQHLYLVPVATIEISILGTTVGKQKRFVHGILTPFVIACRAHVTSAPGYTSVVGQCSSRSWNFYIFMPCTAWAPVCACGML